MCSPSFQRLNDTLKSKAAAQGTLQSRPESQISGTPKKYGGIGGAIMAQVLKNPKSINGHPVSGTKTGVSG